MDADTDLLSSLGLDGLIDDENFGRDQDGVIADSDGMRMVFADGPMMRSLQYVMEHERSGAWRAVMQATGHTGGQAIGLNLDRKLAAKEKPALAALPLEACLVFLERHFAVHGWGKLKLDLADAAEHGLVVARMNHSFLGDSMPAVIDFVDPVLAGMLRGFFEYISGQTLACEEIGCVRRGAAHCTFVIVPPERLTPVMPLLGREPADAIIARLRG